MEGGPPGFPQGFSCPGVLGWHRRAARPCRTGLSPSLELLSSRLPVAGRFLTRWEAAALPRRSHDPFPATPAGLALERFRLIRVRSPLLADSRLISLPRGTKMFQFPRFPLLELCVGSRATRHDSGRVTPFGNLRLDLRGNKPELFAALPRPSSAHDAKASPARP